jgi:hypothetical protein
MTTRYYKYERNARAAARKAGLDPDTVVQPCAAGLYSVDFAPPSRLRSSRSPSPRQRRSPRRWSKSRPSEPSSVATHTVGLETRTRQGATPPEKSIPI